MARSKGRINQRPMGSYVKGRAMINSSASFTTARVSRTAATTHANFKHGNWPAASKPAFYAAFYAVDEALGGLIG